MMKMVGSVLLVAAIAVSGCKGETKEIDKPETLDRLSKCETSLTAKVEYANTLNDRIDELEKGATPASAGDSAVVVTIEGEVMKITAGSGKGPNSGKGDAKGNAKDEELYAAFVKQLKRSRGSIKKCYQAALKKDSRLSTKTISLNIQVNYKTNGKVKGASFNPQVSSAFKQCMNGVAKGWVLPAMPRSVTFNYKQTLTPE